MSTDPAIVQKLIELRLAGLRKASQNRDVDELMSWHSNDAKFIDPVQNVSLVGKEAVRTFYAGVYHAIPSFKVVESQTTGFTPEFVVSEMKCEGQAGTDLPALGCKAGDTLNFTGVSLFWWKWEGEGEAWDGSLTDEAVRGWKLVEEHAYHQMKT